jgi:hypothetical protein
MSIRGLGTIVAGLLCVGVLAAIAMHVYRSETGSKADAIRIAKDVSPTAPYDDYHVAGSNGTNHLYSYYVVSIGDNGATAESELVG